MSEVRANTHTSCFLSTGVDCELSPAPWLLGDPKGQRSDPGAWSPPSTTPPPRRGEGGGRRRGRRTRRRGGWGLRQRGSRADAGAIKATGECDECGQSVKPPLKSQYYLQDILRCLRGLDKDKMGRGGERRRRRRRKKLAVLFHPKYHHNQHITLSISLLTLPVIVLSPLYLLLLSSTHTFSFLPLDLGGSVNTFDKLRVGGRRRERERFI